MYRIKIDYSTGNSFGTEYAVGYIELEWSDLDVAKENLIAIKEHYSIYKNFNQNRYYRKKVLSLEEIEKLHGNKFWFVRNHENWDYKTNKVIDKNIELDPYSISYIMRLKSDEGKFIQMNCFWCGYFEMLYGAEIQVDNSELKFTV